MRPCAEFTWAALAACAACWASAAGEMSAGTGRRGIAARYPGDVGIEKDADVMLVEGFESGSHAELSKRWTQVAKAGPLSFAGDVPEGSPGSRCLLITATAGADTGGHLFRRFKTGVDTMHARFYVKFAKDMGYVHHFVGIGADIKPDQWLSPKAGSVPRGDVEFDTEIAPKGDWGKHPPPGSWMFYTGWHQMKGRWGNLFKPDAPEIPQRGRWYCVEFMIQCNSSPEKSDGRQAFWIDGRKAGDFGNFRWRTTDRLKLNYFWPKLYVTEQAARHNKDKNPPKRSRVYFDHMVVAKSYIGPIAAKVDAAAPARPPVQLKPDRDREQRLRRKLIDIVKKGCAGKVTDVNVEVGGRPKHMKLYGADDAGIKVSMRGMQLPLRWKQIKPNRLYGIASKLTGDHRLLADYCEAAGLVEEHEREKALVK